MRLLRGVYSTECDDTSATAATETPPAVLRLDKDVPSVPPKKKKRPPCGAAVLRVPTVLQHRADAAADGLLKSVVVTLTTPISTTTITVDNVNINNNSIVNSQLGKQVYCWDKLLLK